MEQKLLRIAQRVSEKPRAFSLSSASQSGLDMSQLFFLSCEVVRVLLFQINQIIFKLCYTWRSIAQISTVVFKASVDSFEISSVRCRERVS